MDRVFFGTFCDFSGVFWVQSRGVTHHWGLGHNSSSTGKHWGWLYFILLLPVCMYVYVCFGPKIHLATLCVILHLSFFGLRHPAIWVRPPGHPSFWHERALTHPNTMPMVKFHSMLVNWQLGKPEDLHVL